MKTKNVVSLALFLVGSILLTSCNKDDNGGSPLPNNGAPTSNAGIKEEKTIFYKGVSDGNNGVNKADKTGAMITYYNKIGLITELHHIGLDNDGKEYVTGKAISHYHDNGLIKEIIVYSYNHVTQQLEEVFDEKSTFTYDSQNRLIESEIFGTKTVNTSFDEKNRPTETKTYDKSGNLTSRFVYTWSDKSIIFYKEMKVYDENDVYTSKSINEFDDRGNIVKNILYDENDQVTLEMSYEYNDKNDETRSVSSYGDETIHIYKYNNKNKYIEKKTIEKSSLLPEIQYSVTEKEYKYY